jgi:hypothetical protein
MNIYFKIGFTLISLGILFGFVIPSLISAQDDIMVAVGALTVFLIPVVIAQIWSKDIVGAVAWANAKKKEIDSKEV